MGETLKIGMLSWESLHSIRVGGLAQAVTGMAEGLADNGQEVHVFTRSEAEQEDHNLINGVHYHRCKFNPRGSIFEHTEKMCKSMTNCVREVEGDEGRFDIIHGHDWMIADALDRLQDHETVMSYHSTEYGRCGGEKGTYGNSGRIAEKEWLAGYVSDKIVTVSQTMKDELESIYQIPSEKINVVPNGSFVTDLERDADASKVKEKFGVNSSAPMVMFLGRMDYQKGPDIMLNAVPYVLDHRSDAEFLMVGDGGMRNYLESRANEIGISNSIRFPGYITESEKLDLLTASDLVCIPSRNEPFGLVLFEAWSAGNAVVASNVGGLSENIENFYDGIKTTPDPEPIAWGINFAIDDPNLAQQMGKNGKRKLKNFSWDKIGRRLLEIYAESESSAVLDDLANRRLLNSKYRNERGKEKSTWLASCNNCSYVGHFTLANRSKKYCCPICGSKRYDRNNVVPRVCSECKKIMRVKKRDKTGAVFECWKCGNRESVEWDGL